MKLLKKIIRIKKYTYVIIKNIDLKLFLIQTFPKKSLNFLLKITQKMIIITLILIIKGKFAMSLRII
ncbi:integral membrane protein TerC [Lactococcus lactis subsp. lactis IO-1]|nr:integral membrane protein TerC [Lactococcus lactis subsp. lactis IO-1]